MDIIAIFLGIVLFIFIWLYFRNSNGNAERIKKLVNKFPGPRNYPLVGTVLPALFLTKPELFKFLRKQNKDYGPIYRVWIGNTPAVHLTDPKYVEIILSSSAHTSKGFGYFFMLPWLGDGLLTSKGEKWHRHRKLLTPTFHFKILETFMDVFVKKSTLLVDLLAKEANGKTFNVFPYVTRCALDIISETAMGIEVQALSQESNEYVDAIYGVCREIVHRITRFWLNIDFIYYKTQYGKRFLKYIHVLHTTTNKVINERKELLRKKPNFENTNVEQDDIGTKKRKAFLDMLIEASKDGTVLTNEQIREEVDTFLFEGHDTTTASISWTIFLLGLHPDIQEKTYEEVSQILGNDEPLKFSDLSELKYLERVIKESLRLYPSVSFISRLASDDIKIDNYIIPKGVTVGIHILDVLRNEKYFPNPEKFDPDRFLPENSMHRHPYAYIPFSAGPRNCIGQKFALSEEKVVLSYVIKNFKIKSTQTIDNVNPVSDLIVRPDQGIYVTLEKRT